MVTLDIRGASSQLRSLQHTFAAAVQVGEARSRLCAVLQVLALIQRVTQSFSVESFAGVTA